MTAKTTAKEGKELAPIKAQATKALTYASGLTIKTDADEAKAAAELSRINEIGSTLKERKDKILQPQLDAVAALRELFKPAEDSVKSAVATIKEKLGAYHTAKEKKAEEEKAKLAARVDRGTMTKETAGKKIEGIDQPGTVVRAEAGGVQYSKIAKTNFTNLKDLSGAQLKKLAEKGYIAWDTTAAGKAAKAGEKIEGVTVTHETQVSNKRA